jgi:hypothetical protein
MEPLRTDVIPSSDDLFVQEIPGLDGLSPERDGLTDASSDSQIERRLYRKSGSSNDRQQKKE